ncbi:MAG: amidohydrolase family protein [Oceanospirillaceae bacterium]
MKIIDPHLHLFAIEQGEYSWLKPTNAPYWPDKKIINRNFTVLDLALQPPLEHGGFIHVEAGFDNNAPWREVQWLEASVNSPFKTIANIDLTLASDDFLVLIKRLMQHDSVIGFRHILDEDATELLRNQQVQQNLQTIADYQAIFECQLLGSDTPAIIQLKGILSVIPTLKIVINHAAFPNSMHIDYHQWQSNIAALANHDNVYIKASGWEMINRQYSQQHIQQIVDFLLLHFSVEKVMLASNFPLCLFSCPYTQLWETYNRLDLTKQQKQCLMHDNAKRIYQL